MEDISSPVVLGLIALAMGLLKILEKALEWLWYTHIKSSRSKTKDKSLEADRLEGLEAGLAEVEEKLDALTSKVNTIGLRHETCNEEMRRRISEQAKELSTAQERERLLYKERLNERDGIIEDQGKFMEGLAQGLGGGPKKKRSQRTPEENTGPGENY